MGNRTRVNVHEFYTADPRRQESEEISFGEGWTDHTDPSSTYRLSWVALTGEIYSVREPHPGGGLLAAVFDHYNVHQADVDEMKVEILAVADLASVEEALAGWRERVGEHDSLRWARERLRRTPQPAERGLDAGRASGPEAVG